MIGMGGGGCGARNEAGTSFSSVQSCRSLLPNAEATLARGLSQPLK